MAALPAFDGTLGWLQQVSEAFNNPATLLDLVLQMSHDENIDNPLVRILAFSQLVIFSFKFCQNKVVWFDRFNTITLTISKIFNKDYISVDELVSQLSIELKDFLANHIKLQGRDEYHLTRLQHLCDTKYSSLIHKLRESYITELDNIKDLFNSLHNLIRNSHVVDVRDQISTISQKIADKDFDIDFEMDDNTSLAIAARKGDIDMIFFLLEECNAGTSSKLSKYGNVTDNKDIKDIFIAYDSFDGLISSLHRATISVKSSKQNDKKRKQPMKSYEENEHDFEAKAGSVYFEHPEDTSDKLVKVKRSYKKKPKVA